MPFDQHNVPLPPDGDGKEDVLASRRRHQDNSPLPPDPPGREDIMTPEPVERARPR